MNGGICYFSYIRTPKNHIIDVDMSLQVILFLLLGIGAIATGIGTVTRRNPVAAAMNLIAHFFMLSGLYLTLQAQFIAVVQVIVYAGAIMVLVVFVIMLLNLGKEEAMHEKLNVRKVMGVVMAGVLVVQMIIIFMSGKDGVQVSAFPDLSPKAVQLGTTESIGNVLFNNYLFPFEIISLLLLAALIGAVILAKRKIE